MVQKKYGHPLRNLVVSKFETKGLRKDMCNDEYNKTFKRMFVRGECTFSELEHYIAEFHNSNSRSLEQFLGFSEEDYLYWISHNSRDTEAYLLAEKQGYEQDVLTDLLATYEEFFPCDNNVTMYDNGFHQMGYKCPSSCELYQLGDTIVQERIHAALRLLDVSKDTLFKKGYVYRMEIKLDMHEAMVKQAVGRLAAIPVAVKYIIPPLQSNLPSDVKDGELVKVLRSKRGMVRDKATNERKVVELRYITAILEYTATLQICENLITEVEERSKASLDRILEDI